LVLTCGVVCAATTPPSPLLHTRRVLPYLSSQQAANALWGWSRCGRWPPQAWLDRFFLETHKRLLGFKARELSSLLCALAAGRKRPPRQWMVAYLTASYAHMGAMSGQGLANVAWALTQLRWVGPGAADLHGGRCVCVCTGVRGWDEGCLRPSTQLQYCSGAPEQPCTKL
jgi:hypothetical protein